MSRAKVLTCTTPSTCFEDLRYFKGNVFAVFAKDGSSYTYPCTLAQAREWFSDPSPGGYFNDQIRD